jgi:hypothetical protein
MLGNRKTKRKQADGVIIHVRRWISLRLNQGVSLGFRMVREANEKFDLISVLKDDLKFLFVVHTDNIEKKLRYI